MRILLLLISSVFSMTTAFGQYCVSGGPTNTADSNVESVSLIGESGIINYTGCPGVTGVEEDLGQSVTLNATNSYSISIQFGTCGGSFAGAGEAWIDYNQNGIFEASESIGTWTGTPPAAMSIWNFTVPAGAVNGSTRIRVIQQEGGAAVPPLDPCAAFTWGSAVDFSIVIQGGSGSPSACTAGPTSTADSNLEALTINGTSGTSINYTGCPGVIGLETYTAETVTLGQGNNFSADLQFGTCGGNYGGAGEAWIDFNQNSVYEPSESIGTWTGTPPSSITTFYFQVPITALLGATKMRVIQQEGGALPLDPCATFTWGSATDFNIIIEEGVDCSAYLGDNLSDAIVVPTLPYSHNHSTTVCYTNQNPVYNSPDVYYKVTTDPANPMMSVSLCGSAFDTFLSVVEPNGTVIIGNDDGATCSPQSELTFSTEAYPVVYIIVEGWGNEMGDYTLNINEQPLGIQNLDNNSLSIWPNPTTGDFFMNNTLSGDVEIQNVHGQTVLTTFVKSDASINTDSLKKGVYFVQFTSNGKTIVKKLIKK